MAADTEWWYKNKDGEKTGAPRGGDGVHKGRNVRVVVCVLLCLTLRGLVDREREKTRRDWRAVWVTSDMFRDLIA